MTYSEEYPFKSARDFLTGLCENIIVTLTKLRFHSVTHDRGTA